jgi:hypothetical protein
MSRSFLVLTTLPPVAMPLAEMMIIGPGSTAQVLHRDADNWRTMNRPDAFEVTVSCMFAITDFTGQGTYVLADGSKLPSLQFTLRQLRVGNQVIRNVAASVAPVTSRYPLLGQSFLSRLPPWSIDYRRHVLV